MQIEETKNEYRNKLRQSPEAPLTSTASIELWGPRLTQQANRRPTRGRKPAGGRPVEQRVRRHDGLDDDDSQPGPEVLDLSSFVYLDDKMCSRGGRNVLCNEDVGTFLATYLIVPFADVKFGTTLFELGHRDSTNGFIRD